MNFKKSIVYLLLSIFALIFVYNYVLPFFVLQNYNANSMGMGMGKHMWEGMSNNNQYNYNNFGNIIILAIIVLAGFLLLDKAMVASENKKCKKCGLTIESSRWKVCPRCSNNLHQKKEE